jgi:hypothetical protein
MNLLRRVGGCCDYYLLYEHTEVEQTSLIILAVVWRSWQDVSFRVAFLYY